MPGLVYLEVCVKNDCDVFDYGVFFLLVLFRFAFPRASGSQWNIVLLAFVPICGGIIPYLYVLEVSARYFPSTRVS